MKKTSAKQAKKIEKRILAVVADLKKAKKARKIEHPKLPRNSSVLTFSPSSFAGICC